MRTAVLKIVQLHVIGIDKARGESERRTEERPLLPAPPAPPPKERQWGARTGGAVAGVTHHLAVVQGSLGLAGALRGAASALSGVPAVQRRLADLEDGARGPGALFAPIRCRTHSYTPPPSRSCCSARPSRAGTGRSASGASPHPPRQPRPGAARRGLQTPRWLLPRRSPPPPHRRPGCCWCWRCREPAACRGAEAASAVPCSISSSWALQRPGRGGEGCRGATSSPLQQRQRQQRRRLEQHRKPRRSRRQLPPAACLRRSTALRSRAGQIQRGCCCCCWRPRRASIQKGGTETRRPLFKPWGAAPPRPPSRPPAPARLPPTRPAAAAEHKGSSRRRSMRAPLPLSGRPWPRAGARPELASQESNSSALIARLRGSPETPPGLKRPEGRGGAGAAGSLSRLCRAAAKKVIRHAPSSKTRAGRPPGFPALSPGIKANMDPAHILKVLWGRPPPRLNPVGVLFLCLTDGVTLLTCRRGVKQCRLDHGQSQGLGRCCKEKDTQQVGQELLRQRNQLSPSREVTHTRFSF